MTDALQKLVNARYRSLTDADTLRRNARQEGARRRVCGSCWQVADKPVWDALFKAWRAKHKRCTFYSDYSYECQGHWARRTGSWVIHRYEADLTRCPRCDGKLHEVTL